MISCIINGTELREKPEGIAAPLSFLNFKRRGVDLFYSLVQRPKIFVSYVSLLAPFF